jgi:hypothetical protein
MADYLACLITAWEHTNMKMLTGRNDFLTPSSVMSDQDDDTMTRKERQDEPLYDILGLLES